MQYTRNTVTGASTADALIVLVDVNHGIVEQPAATSPWPRCWVLPHLIVAGRQDRPGRGRPGRLRGTGAGSARARGRAGRAGPADQSGLQRFAGAWWSAEGHPVVRGPSLLGLLENLRTRRSSRVPSPSRCPCRP
ncbi:hypothetical protein QJS66_19750 [Kocuria rhizophila]|nr:hypothetical protein QJS66_19750 [Kocuria rhizophila]